MSKLRVHCFSVSLDGFGAGPNQDLNNPLGVGGEDLHQWLFPTRAFQKMQGEGEDKGTTGVDNDFVDDPPYHTPVFVLTHHPRAAIKMDGGTTFHFVTDGIHAALQRAKEEANGLDVRLGGGAATIRQYLQAGLVDELHVAVSPIILGSGESLFGGIDLLKLGYKCAERVTSPAALHMVLTKGTT
jgi:dihydrofolate reductase